MAKTPNGNIFLEILCRGSGFMNHPLRLETIISSGSVLTSMSLMLPLYSSSSGFQWACQLETSPISIDSIKFVSLLTTHSIMSNLVGLVLSLSKGGYLIEIFDNVMISRKDK